MSESKHTPGPWFDWQTREWLYEPQKLLTNYPDACLIAAAPDLLEALQKLRRIEALYKFVDDPENVLRAVFDSIESIAAPVVAQASGDLA